MSIADLKTKLADIPGIHGLTMTLQSGRQLFSWGGKSVALHPLANEGEIEEAIRAAHLSPDKPAPPTSYSLAVRTFNAKAKSMSATGATFAAGTMSGRLKSIREKVAASSTKMDAALTKMEQAISSHDALADNVSQEADAVMAEIGQFSNGAPA